MNVFIIVAMSLDGFIAQRADQASTDWTSLEDKKFFTQKTKEAGVIVMGETTFGTIGFPLKDRLNIIYSHLSESEFEQKYDLKLDPEKIRLTSKKPDQLIADLEQEGFQQVAICGGSTIYTMFFQAGVVDEFFITLETVIFGNGLKLFKRSELQKLKLVECQKMNEKGALLLHYET